MQIDTNRRADGKSRNQHAIKNQGMHRSYCTNTNDSVAPGLINFELQYFEDVQGTNG